MIAANVGVKIAREGQRGRWRLDRRRARVELVAPARERGQRRDPSVAVALEDGIPRRSLAVGRRQSERADAVAVDEQSRRARAGEVDERRKGTYLHRGAADR